MWSIKSTNLRTYLLISIAIYVSEAQTAKLTIQRDINTFDDRRIVEMSTRCDLRDVETSNSSRGPTEAPQSGWSGLRLLMTSDNC